MWKWNSTASRQTLHQLFAKTRRRHIKGTSKIGAQIGDRVWSFECSVREGLRKQWQNWESLSICSLSICSSFDEESSWRRLTSLQSLNSLSWFLISVYYEIILRKREFVISSPQIYLILVIFHDKSLNLWNLLIDQILHSERIS